MSSLVLVRGNLSGHTGFGSRCGFLLLFDGAHLVHCCTFDGIFLGSGRGGLGLIKTLLHTLAVSNLHRFTVRSFINDHIALALAILFDVVAHLLLWAG